MKKILHASLLLALVAAWGACRKMDENYKKYLVPGGLTYPQKALLPVAYAGRNRVELRWLRGSDQSVTRAEVFWNNYADSMAVDIPQGQDTISVVIDPLEEKTYTFDIRTYDAAGHASVPVEVLCASYGDNFQASLLPRLIRSATVSSDGATTVTWEAANLSGGALRTELAYTDASGKEDTLSLPAGDSVIVIPAIPPGSTFTYRTAYIPDTLAIDTFYTASETNEDFVIDKSAWQALVLPTDEVSTASASFALSNLWNGCFATLGGGCSYASGNNTTLPQWFTIDLGAPVPISKVVEHQAPTSHLYTGSAVKTFELWGSNNPAPDGSWERWDSLGTFHSFKPSGLPMGQTTADDLAYGSVQGEAFSFVTPTLPYRYLRWKTLETYSNQGQVVISELDIHTRVMP